MREYFQNILDIEGVEGVAYLSADNELLFHEFAVVLPEKAEKLNWPVLLGALEKMQESELIFEHKRIYVKKGASGYILVVLDRFVSIAMVRMNCDIAFPALSQIKRPKGLGRFFGLK